ncbi:recombinase family protein [Blautia sp. HCP28S3_G10]|uniref:recombinase family protein n=1 Tax=Blautia sp. HCP28S3_G10 TaxID=3438908 RepID=UPI003F89E6BC
MLCDLSTFFHLLDGIFKYTPPVRWRSKRHTHSAYVRVSTDNDEQTSSYELQKNYYTDYIKAQPGWEFVGIYDDEGISGTSLAHRKGMQQLIEDCKAGKIDLILTKSIARFARNIVDCLSVIETLKNLDPPVGVKFEADNIYTLDSNGRMILTILASVADVLPFGRAKRAIRMQSAGVD